MLIHRQADMLFISTEDGGAFQCPWRPIAGRNPKLFCAIQINNNNIFRRIPRAAPNATKYKKKWGRMERFLDATLAKQVLTRNPDVALSGSPAQWLTGSLAHCLLLLYTNQSTSPQTHISMATHVSIYYIPPGRLHQSLLCVWCFVPTKWSILTPHRASFSISRESWVSNMEEVNQQAPPQAQIYLRLASAFRTNDMSVLISGLTNQRQTRHECFRWTKTLSQLSGKPLDIGGKTYSLIYSYFFLPPSHPPISRSEFDR